LPRLQSCQAGSGAGAAQGLSCRTDLDVERCLGQQVLHDPFVHPPHQLLALCLQRRLILNFNPSSIQGQERRQEGGRAGRQHGVGTQISPPAEGPHPQQARRGAATWSRNLKAPRATGTNHAPHTILPAPPHTHDSNSSSSSSNSTHPPGPWWLCTRSCLYP
jgi:hypothetical protein